MGAADGSIFARQRVTVSGFEIPYLEGGREGDMEPLVYLHGMGGAGRWEAYHMALGTVAFTIAPQLPGWQEGHPPEGITSVGDYASLVLEFLDAINIGRCIMAGHSIGGWMALYLAAHHPERVAKLILSDPMGLDVPEAPGAQLDALDEEAFASKVFARPGLIATAQAYGFGAEWENVRQGPEFARQWKGQALVAELLKGSYSDPELLGMARGIPVETLIVWGRMDGIVPVQHGEALHAALPQSRLSVLERAGHLPMTEKPETFHRLTRSFLLGAMEELPEVVTV